MPSCCLLLYLDFVQFINADFWFFTSGIAVGMLKTQSRPTCIPVQKCQLVALHGFWQRNCKTRRARWCKASVSLWFTLLTPLDQFWCKHCGRWALAWPTQYVVCLPFAVMQLEAPSKFSAASLDFQQVTSLWVTAVIGNVSISLPSHFNYWWEI